MKSNRLVSISVPILLVALVLGACGRDDGRRSGPAPNIILISIDTLRADRLGYHGYPRPTSPFLDRLAARSMVFEQAVVNTHGTTPSHASMLSGLYQQTHRVGFDTDDLGLNLAIPPTVRLLPEMLGSAGYTTIGVTDGGNIGRRFGFDRGFDRHDDRGGGIRRVLRRSLRYLAELGEAEEEKDQRPVFLFVHTYEVHSPYDPPEEYAQMFLDPESSSTFDATSENLTRFSNRADQLADDDLARISDLYDAGIRYADEQLEAFFEELETEGLLDGALVVITSDHGEEFGEHGGLLHRGLLYDELLRVPLIVHGPNVVPGSSQEAASLVDLVPTILGYSGVAGPAHLEGVDLLDPEREPRAVAVSQYAAGLYSVRSAQWKLIASTLANQPELFNLVEDPEERYNVYAPDHPMAVELRRELRQWLAMERPEHGQGARSDLSAEERLKLEKLGYL